MKGAYYEKIIRCQNRRVNLDIGKMNTHKPPLPGI